MGGLRMTGRDLATYELMSRAGSDIKNGMMQYGLSRAADVNPTQEFSQDQAAELEAAAGAVDAQGKPLYKINGNEGGTYSVTPTAGGETSTITPGMHRMGGKAQDTPFSEDQISAESARRRSRILGSSGDYKGEAELSGMAKKYDDSHNTAAINSAGKAALKGLENESPSIRALAMRTARMNKAADLGLIDQAMTDYTMSQALSDSVFDDLHANATTKLAAGDTSGIKKLLDYGIPDGNKSDVTLNADGSIMLKYGGKEKIVPSSEIEGQLSLLADKKARRAFALKSLEQKLTTAAEQAKSDIKDKSAIGQAEARLKTSTANFYDGAKSAQAEAAAAASRARAEGSGGPSIGQQRLDEGRVRTLTKEAENYYTFDPIIPDGKPQVSRNSQHLYSQLLRAGVDPAAVEGMIHDLRSNSKDVADMDKRAANVLADMKRQREAGMRPPAAAPTPPKPEATNQAGMVRADAPRPAAPVAPPTAGMRASQPQTDSRFNEAGYVDTASTIAGAMRGDRNALLFLSRMSDEGGLTLGERAKVAKLLGR